MIKIGNIELDDWYFEPKFRFWKRACIGQSAVSSKYIFGIYIDIYDKNPLDKRCVIDIYGNNLFFIKDFIQIYNLEASKSYEYNMVDEIKYKIDLALEKASKMGSFL